MSDAAGLEAAAEIAARKDYMFGTLYKLAKAHFETLKEFPAIPNGDDKKMSKVLFDLECIIHECDEIMAEEKQMQVWFRNFVERNKNENS